MKLNSNICQVDCLYQRKDFKLAVRAICFLHEINNAEHIFVLVGQSLIKMIPLVQYLLSFVVLMV